MSVPTELDAALVDACGQTPSIFCEATWNLTHNRFLSRAADWLVTKPILALIIIGITALLNKWLRRLVTQAIIRFTNREQLAVSALSKIGVDAPSSLSVVDPRLARRTSTLTAVSRAVVSSLLWTISTLLVIGLFGIQLGPLLAGVGIAGVAVGLGAQSLVRDCIAGFFVIMEDQFGVGDDVDLGLAVGVIAFTRCPLAIPPIAGLHDICAMRSRSIVSSRVCTLHSGRCEPCSIEYHVRANPCTRSS